MISSFFVISPRGDTIISKDYRGDIKRDMGEAFFRKVKFWEGDAPPIFYSDGVTFAHIKKNNLFLLFTTRGNTPPTILIGVLERIARLCKDYIGVLNEDSCRRNFVLIYEILDEVMDYGFPQGTATGEVKAYIMNEAQIGSGSMVEMATKQAKSLQSKMNKGKSISADASRKGLAGDGKKSSELFVDNFEKITCVFAAETGLLHHEIVGNIAIKSYLSGSPSVQIELNKEIVIGQNQPARGYGPQIVLDDINYHDCVNLEFWENERLLMVNPPDGESTIMNYRVSSQFPPPFAIQPYLDIDTPSRLELTLKVRADFAGADAFGKNVLVVVPVPYNSGNVTASLLPDAQGEEYEYKAHKKTVEWKIKKFSPTEERVIRIKVGRDTKVAEKSIKSAIGPINLVFEIPQFNCSGLHVGAVKILDQGKGKEPHRWIRKITQSNSYVCRV